MLTLDLYGIPIPWKRPRARGKIFFDAQAKEKEHIKWQIRSQFRNNPLLLPIKMDMTFFMPIPKYTSGIRKKEMIAGNLHHIKRPDIDNLQKFFLDCMNGLVFQDDSQVVEIHAKKVYADNPGTLIRLYPITHHREKENEDS